MCSATISKLSKIVLSDLSKFDKMSTLNSRNGKKILGILLVLFTNLVYIGSNYAVRWAELGASEVSLVRGSLQVLVFSILLIRNRGNKAETEPKNNGNWSTLKKYLLVSLHGFLNAAMGFIMVMAVPLMPIGDLIVICFSSPVFSVILESLILKRRMTILSVVLSISIGILNEYVFHIHRYISSVGGDILAVQPSFIFSPIKSPSHSNSSNAKNSSLTEGGMDTIESERESSGYMLGVILCLLGAASASIINITQITLNKNFVEITKNHLIVSCGAFKKELSDF